MALATAAALMQWTSGALLVWHYRVQADHQISTVWGSEQAWDSASTATVSLQLTSGLKAGMLGSCLLCTAWLPGGAGTAGERMACSAAWARAVLLPGEEEGLLMRQGFCPAGIRGTQWGLQERFHSLPALQYRDWQMSLPPHLALATQKHGARPPLVPSVNLRHCQSLDWTVGSDQGESAETSMQACIENGAAMFIAVTDGPMAGGSGGSDCCCEAVVLMYLQVRRMRLHLPPGPAATMRALRMIDTMTGTELSTAVPRQPGSSLQQRCYLWPMRQKLFFGLLADFCPGNAVEDSHRIYLWILSKDCCKWTSKTANQSLTDWTRGCPKFRKVKNGFVSFGSKCCLLKRLSKQSCRKSVRGGQAGPWIRH